MARKRIIDPNIWESPDFATLSLLGKVIFIGMFSLADDEGRGKANPVYLRSKLFPYNTEDVSLDDIRHSLEGIKDKMSVIFYSVKGTQYYALTHWNLWQKIDRPTKSILPSPDDAEQLDESSTNDRRVLDEGSLLMEWNGIEKNRKEKNMNGMEMNVKEPSISDIMEYGSSKGISERVCQEFYDYNSEKGWIFKGEPMENWRTALGAWNRKVKTYSNQNYEQRKSEPGELEKRLCVDLDADI